MARPAEKVNISLAGAPSEEAATVERRMAVSEVK